MKEETVMKEEDYKENAMDIYHQHFNPDNVPENMRPNDTQTIILDYAESFKQEHIHCDPDLLHHELVLILNDKHPDWNFS